MPLVRSEDRQTIKHALSGKNLTLYLGAGVSVGSGLLPWEKLVLAMYFSTISEKNMPGWRPFPNYLYAISEWLLKNNYEPLEITARKIRKYLVYDNGSEQKFFDKLYNTLYEGLLHDYDAEVDDYNLAESMGKNTTLQSVKKLIESQDGAVGSVITYNYDNMLELSLENNTCQPVFSNCTIDDSKLPVFHVHGYIPIDKQTKFSKPEDIIFTEDQYHRVARDPYHWSNLIQIKTMSNSVGLMIGLSLTDRNMRRLLDAVQNAPIKNNNFALLQRKSLETPGDEVLDKIHQNAKDYLNLFPGGAIKSEYDPEESVFRKGGQVKSDREVTYNKFMGGVKGPRYRYEITRIIEHVKSLEEEQHTFVLKQLGITPIWFDEFEQIPIIINEIIK